jgi:prepilin-type N-terminal cleavage/methylation domain-containing protein
MVKELRKGFTLIELLIVMAILGVLAVVVLVAINPVQQLARTRDAGRKSGIAQMGRSLEAYYTSHNGSYVTESTTWLTTLVNAGEISTAPSAIPYGVTGITGACTGNTPSNWCYDATTASGGEPAIVYTELESTSDRSKCTSGTAYFVWSTADGRAGLVCRGSAPVPGAQTWNSVQ